MAGYEYDNYPQIVEEFHLAEWCHEKAMEFGEMVGWCNDDFKEPRYQLNMSVDENGLVKTIRTLDVLQFRNFLNLYLVSKQTPVFFIYAILDAPCKDTIFVNHDFILNKKLMVGNNGAFYLTDYDCDLKDVRAVDDYLGSLEIGKPVPDRCEQLNCFGLVPMIEFQKYLNSLIERKEVVDNGT